MATIPTTNADTNTNTYSTMLDASTLPDVPPKVDIRTHIYKPLPRTRHSPIWATAPDPAAVSQNAIHDLVAALEAHDNDEDHELAECFLPDDYAGGGAHWRDSLALTAHLRTFSGRKRIVPALKGLARARGFGGVKEVVAVVGQAQDAKWIECTFAFSTTSPALAECGGKLMLLPDDDANWRIWCLVTWLVAWDAHRADEALLRVPSLPISEESSISTDVVIVGGGNSGLILAARLKALAIPFIVIEKNARVGDNWALRYDHLKFHTGRGWGEMPYLPYPPNVTSPTRNELTTQLRRFSDEFDLGTRVLTSSHIISTSYSPSPPSLPQWTLTIANSTTGSERTITTKSVVLATAPGFIGTRIPALPDRALFSGPVIHSDAFKNATQTLSTQDVKSVIIVGSANTAFDVLEDCHEAGLRATMVQRSPTYVMPMGHLLHPRGLGMYDAMSDKTVGDVVVFGTPLHVGGPMLAGVHQELDALEPNKYDAVKNAGFQVFDSTSSDLLDVLFNRCGGHLIDMSTGGISLIADGTVPVHSGVHPVRYTPSGVVLSNGDALDADAVVWCTGFGTQDGRCLLPDMLGKGADEIAVRMEPTWGVDAEGEVRGLWRRNEGVEGLWVLAGGGANQRWHSNVIALQIKGMLEGVLPEAYRGMPARPHENGA